jgi:HEAT repeat protein
MTTGIHRTWNVLARTRNRAAVSVLAAALGSHNAEVRAGALRALARRTDPESLQQVLEHYGRFGEQERVVLADALRDIPRWLTTTLGDAVDRGDAAHCQNACHIAILCRDYDLIPRLLAVTENRSHPHAAQVAATLLRLASLLHHELREDRGQRTRRDPFFARRHVLAAIEQSLARYERHQRLEIIEAFLLLAPSSNPVLRRILQDAHDPCHAQVVASLSSSAATGVLELLIELLRDTQVPASALGIIARRTDRKFLDLLLRTVGHPVSLRVLHNMSRFDRVEWLQSRRDVLLELDGQSQAAAVEMAAAADISRDDQFELLVMLLRRGQAEGRRASCAALADFHRPQAVPLVLAALQDADRGVQAAAARQLRLRHVPHALERLVAMLDSPAAEVRDAARDSLQEFSFTRYQASFDLLDNDSRRTIGRLVFQVDAAVRPRLANLLGSPSFSIRQRAIDMIVAMGAEDAMADVLQTALGDVDVAVRAAAAAALGCASNADVIHALEKAATDKHRSVREAAEQSLVKLRARLPGNATHNAPIGSET